MRNAFALLTSAAILLLGSMSSDAAAEILRDPTRPYSAPQHVKQARPNFKVNAIIVSSKRQIAIINGKRVGVGEQINGATVVSIAKRELVLDVGGREITLQLNNGGTRQ